jgi:PTH1 family peptidyl-tRNA hydrolase
VDHLVVGLGNPGPTYEGSPHNIGYMVVDELAHRHGYPRPKRGFDGRCSEGVVGGRPTLLLQPTTFMNDSAAAASPLLQCGP